MLNGGGGLNPDGLSLDLQFAADKTLTARRGPTPDFTRGSTGTFVGSNGLIQSAAIDLPRFDHDPVTLACKGLLIEESRANLCLRSENFGTTWGTFNSSTSLISQVAPNGDTSAYSVVENTGSGAHSIFQSIAFAGTTNYTFSVFVKAGSRNFASLLEQSSGGSIRRTFFNLSTGEVGTKNASHTASTQQLPNGWWRLIISFTSGAAASANIAIELASADNVSSYVGNGSGNIFLWGAQLEIGSFPTSYIPTTTTPLTRSADVCSITVDDFTGFYNQSEGTMLTNAFTPASGDRTVLSADDNTANEMIRLRTEGTNPFFKVTDGGSELVAIDAGTVSANTSFKLIGAYKLDDFASSINGGAAVTDTSGTTPTVDRMRIGTGQGGNTMCGCVASLRYYKKRLPNAKLAQLTA